MRKLLLTFAAMLFCSIASFAQTTELTQANFVSAITNNPSGSFILMGDINLGDLGEIEGSAIISSFSGTLNGNGKTITYQASFKVTGDNQNFGLFGSVAGTGRIEKLNVNADVTMSGTGSNATLGLICGFLSDNGQISHCNVSGNINSTAAAAQYGNSSTGLIIGNSEGNLMYSTASGNLVGTGFVGGLVGSMGTVLGNTIDWPLDAIIKGCYFTGSVTAMNSNSAEGYRSFGGGVCGYLQPSSTIELCVAEAVVITGENAKGLTTSGFTLASIFGAKPTIENNYCSGTINGNEIDTDAECVNSNRYITTSGNYNPGTVNDCEEGITLAECIVAKLEAERCPNPNNCDENFYFAVINGKVVLIIGEEQEVEEIICEAPTGFTVVKNEDNTFTASWSANGEGANTSFTENTFILTVTGGDNQNMETTIQDASTNAFYITSERALLESENPYVFTIKSQCDENVFSVPQQVTFYVDPACEANVIVSNVTTTSAKITWQGNVSTVELGDETYTINGGTEYTFNNLTPATSYTAEVTFNCTRHNENNEEESYTRTLTVDFETLGATFITKQDGNFNDPNTWLGNAVPEGNVANITINTGHEVIVNHDLVITDSYKIKENKGVLQITQNGQLINNSTANANANVPGIVEIVSPQKNKNEWTFIGAPFDGYKLETIMPVSGSDISVSKYDYLTANWSDSWAHIGTSMDAGEGYFAWPFYNGTVIFTTYGDVCEWNEQQQRYEVVGYNFTKGAAYELNNGTVTVEKNIIPTTDNTETTDVNEAGNWMALANPYPAKLQVNAFKGANNLQGNCVYVFREGSFDMPATDILMTEGFFVNFASAGTKSVTFTKNQLSYNAGAKASANEFIKLTLINGDKKVRAYLAHNEEAEQGYDIFDANKMFAPTEIAEPYFVTDGIALMKEEFAELPYYATMNVRSFADDTVSFVVENIPEGLSVSIIDGENIIDMVEGGVYTTEILTGENADRFKVLVKKSVSISDVEELEVNIYNDNRHINIETTETDLQVEVYNALGQKVLSTKDRNFTLNQVSAGAYLIKAFNNKASKTQKIVVE